MKKLGLKAFIFNLIISANLYCFDLIDDVDDFIEDIIKLVIMVFVILAIIYFIKKVLKDDNISGKIRKYGRDDDYRRPSRRRNSRIRDEYYDDYDDRIRNDRDYEDDYRNERTNRRERIREEDIRYEYDMRDYDRRERRIPSDIKNNIDSRENDSRYEKVYELKPEYKLKDDKKRIR